jgi:YD repeat-containing protein
LTTNDYYDADGRLIAKSAPGGVWTKTVYDGAGRPTYVYTTDGAAGTTYTEASAVTSDDVLTQLDRCQFCDRPW